MATTGPDWSAREKLIRLQREMVRRLEEDLAEFLRRENTDLRAYRRRYEREVRSFRSVSSKAELIDTVRRSSIVYCGDYHTLRQAQRTVVKILRPIVGQARQVLLGLEMVPSSAEGLVNDFVRGAVSEEHLLDGLSYQERWGFPWKNYRQLFDFARAHGVEIFGLGSTLSDEMTLAARDDLAADFIVDVTLKRPGALLFCLYGDLHVASPHLPGRVEVRLKKHGVKRRNLTVFQNSPDIYWQLVERRIEDSVDTVRCARGKFCVISAPPWVAMQSYKTWMEDQSPLLSAPDDGEDEPPDYYHQVLAMASSIGRFLGFAQRDLDHFSVITATDTKIIDEVEDYCAAGRRCNPPIEDLVMAEIVTNRSFFFAGHATLYLNDLSENRAAEKAAQLVAAKCHATGWADRPSAEPRELFYQIVLWEGVGFFGSKLINPKRKCDHYRDLANFLAGNRGRRLRGAVSARRRVAELLLLHRTYELGQIKSTRGRAGPRRLFRLPPPLFFQAASHLGQILGDALYRSVMSDEIPMSVAQTLFLPLGDEADAARSRYFELVSRVENPPIDKISKDDRF